MNHRFLLECQGDLTHLESYRIQTVCIILWQMCASNGGRYNNRIRRTLVQWYMYDDDDDDDDNPNKIK